MWFPSTNAYVTFPRPRCASLDPLTVIPGCRATHQSQDPYWFSSLVCDTPGNLDTDRKPLVFGSNQRTVVLYCRQEFCFITLLLWAFKASPSMLNIGQMAGKLTLFKSGNSRLFSQPPPQPHPPPSPPSLFHHHFSTSLSSHWQCWCQCVTASA